MERAAFVSYRREQDWAAARDIATVLRVNFGEDEVFLDVDSILAGGEWPEALATALANARALLVLMGPRWLAAQDPVTFQRRLDIEGDWVRREIETGLAADKLVVPLLLNEAEMPPESALPESLRELTRRQAFRLRHDSWRADLERLLAHLAEHAHARPEEVEGILWPEPPAFKPLPLTDEQKRLLRDELPAWQIEVSRIQDDPRNEGTFKEELTRSYQFESFEAAMDYMHGAAPHIDSMDHHPRWENVWRTVLVRLTTWDIGHQLSDRDLVLAKFLDQFFEQRQRPKSFTQ